MKEVLDHGYVRYVDHMGSDLTIVNAARVSFEKESDEYSEADDRLMKFLLDRNELSPFRHASISFEVYAPLLVARQWWKYVVGSDHTMNAWNESSRRYVTEEPVYYSPSWRAAPESAKQGSTAMVIGTDFVADQFSGLLEKAQGESIANYEAALEAGIAPEQARVFLLAYGLYVRWRWTASLQAVMHFLDERADDDAQWEIQQYALAVRELARERFPASIRA